MISILILRHGISEDLHEAEADGRTELERRLTTDGVSQMDAVCRGLAALVSPVDRILSSPLSRAIETADILSRNLGSPAVERCESLEPGGSPLDICRILSEGEADQVALVGHEPDLGILCGFLLTGTPKASVELKKAGAVLIRSASPGSGDGVIAWALPAGCSVALGSAP